MIRQWETMSEDELALLAAQGEEAAFSRLVQRLQPRLRQMTAAYPCMGLEQEDLLQEGFLGVMIAVRRFSPERGTFVPYALLCARSGMASAVRRAAAGKQQPLHNYTPLEQAGDPAADSGLQPEKLLAAEEQVREFHLWMEQELTALEQQVLRLYLAGDSYTEIASRLSSHSKAVDNALQRVRRKLRRFYSTHKAST